MRTRSLLATAALMGIGAALAVGTRKGPVPVARPSSVAPLPTGPGSPAWLSPPPGERARRAAAAARIQTLVRQLSERAARAGGPVELRADATFARVNGHPITGQALVPFPAGARTQEMTPQMFEFLLGRAIDRELSREEARAQGVELTAEQVAQLTEVRQQAIERGERGTAELEYEVEDARGMLIQQALLVKAGGPGPLAGQADVERYYAAHDEEFEPLPADDAARAIAWQKIQLEIRQSLYPEFQRRYAERLRDYLDQMRASASITN